MDHSKTVEVPCNGPCRKRFHPAAVSLDQATINVLLSPARASGLMWLCPKCHQAYNPQQTFPRCKTDLPPELWIMIFRYMDNTAMLRVRATCRRWKNIVDQNYSLRKEFQIKFGPAITMDDRFQPENLFPGSSLMILKSKIICVDGWWPRIGAGLTKLDLSDCKIAQPVFLGMLRETPNLESMSLNGITYTSVELVEVDFRLDKLKYLQCDEVLDVFANMFQMLKQLHLTSELINGGEMMACRLLASAQGTLKELECTLTPIILEQMAGMKRLQLINVIHNGTGESAVQLSRMQATIEEYYVTTATNEDLCEIGRNLTKLDEIIVTLEGQGTVVPTFLVEMSQLTSLTLDGSKSYKLNFDCLKCPNLSCLKLSNLCIIGDSLRNLLTDSPDLQVLELIDCSLNSWLDIFAARLKSLQTLHMWKIQLFHNTMKVPKKLKQLKQLEILNCKLSTEMLVGLLLQCPRLENLSLWAMEAVNDKLVGMLGQLPRLKELCIYGSSITDKSVELIAENCSHIKASIGPGQISNVAKKLLKYVTRSG